MKHLRVGFPKRGEIMFKLDKTLGDCSIITCGTSSRFLLLQCMLYIACFVTSFFREKLFFKSNMTNMLTIL